MRQSTDRILTTHAGSLVRPPALLDLLARERDGAPVDPAELDRVLAESVREVVRRQVETGLDVINDGEFGKHISWSRYVLERLDGFEQRLRDPADRSFPAATHGQDRREFAEFYRQYDPSQGFTAMSGWVVAGPVRYKGQAALAADIARLRAALAGVSPAEVFWPAVAPSSVAPDRKDEHYISEEDCLFAIAEALNEEYRHVVDAGFLLQVDDAYLASYYDVIVPPGTFEDYHRWAEVRIAALNHALRGIPAERVRYHVCWGSWNGPHVYDVELRRIADLLLRANVGGYCLEMANPRHEHEWRVWEQVRLPEDRVLIPGVISHCTNVVEHPELVAERLLRLARLVGRERVIAGTDCGFAQGPFVQRVHPSIMWAKLRAMVEGARLASAELWRRAA